MEPHALRRYMDMDASSVGAHLTELISRLADDLTADADFAGKFCDLFPVGILVVAEKSATV